jgi:ketosteroid isomerase-like protein
MIQVPEPAFEAGSVAIFAARSNGTLPPAPGPVETQLREAMAAISLAYRRRDWSAVVGWYTADAVALAEGQAPARGRDAVRRLIELPAGISIVHHRILPREIVVTGDHAHDWGEFELRCASKGRASRLRRGRYASVWRCETEGSWRICFDMWGRVR